MTITPIVVRPQSLYAWLLAIRPKTLSATFIPCLIGTLMAPIELIQIHWILALCITLTAVCVQIANNLLNDVIDFQKGSDTKDRIGPTRVTSSGLLTSTQVLAASAAFLLLAFTFSVPLIAVGGVFFLVILLISFLLSYLYTGGPYPIAYTGISEPFVMIFYGLVTTIGAYYFQTLQLTADSLIAGIQMGALVMNLLIINNIRDIYEDRKSHKKTLVARFGLYFGKWELTCFTGLAFLLNGYWYLASHKLAAILPSAAILVALNMLRSVWRSPPSALYNRYLGEASLLIIVFGLLLIVGIRIG